MPSAEFATLTTLAALAAPLAAPLAEVPLLRNSVVIGRPLHLLLGRAIPMRPAALGRIDIDVGVASVPRWSHAWDTRS